MVAIRRAPAPPPHLGSQHSDSATSPSRVKASHHDSHFPEQSSPLTDGKSREGPNDKLRDDDSRDTVGRACEPNVILIAHWFLYL
jgi:hypothetical protein